jgi:hypothetical protein
MPFHLVRLHHQQQASPVELSVTMGGDPWGVVGAGDGELALETYSKQLALSDVVVPR